MEKLYKYRYWIVSAVVIAVILGLYLVTPSLSVERLEEMLPHSFWLALVALVSIYCFRIVLFFIPVVLLYTIAGLVFNPLSGIVISYVCLALEMSIGYLMEKKLGRSKVEKLLFQNKRIKAIMDNADPTGNSMCFILRILPVPFDIVSMVLSATGVPYPQYMLFSLLGVTPCLIPYVIAGGAITNPISFAFLFPFGVIIFISTASFVGLNMWMKRSRRKKNCTENGGV